MRNLFLICLAFAISKVHAADYSNELGAFFVDPHVAVGSNVDQGTTVLLGLDAGYLITDQVSAGVGAYGAFGEHGGRDRELGGGPFVRFAQPLTPFLIASVREDLDYVDQRRPSAGNTYRTLTGVASFTTLGMHLRVARVLGISAGYRVSIGLNNSDLGKERSMPFLGFSIGI